MSQLIIGFGYKRLRGKDTAACFCADRIRETYGCARQDFFAKSLKEGIGKGVFGLTNDQLYSEDGKMQVDDFWKTTPRDILQRAGTEAMRNEFGQHIWVETLHRRILNDTESHVVISDVRFPNEAEAIKSWGGYVIRIDRDIPFNGDIDRHASEMSLDGWDGWDYIIKNDGEVDELYANLQIAIEEIAKAKKVKCMGDDPEPFI